MIEHFTETATKLIMSAQEESLRCGFNFDREEFLLLALLKLEANTPATGLLNSRRLTAQAFESVINDTRIKRDLASTSMGRVLKSAFDLSRQREQSEVSTAHLLLALLEVHSNADTTTEQILKLLGVDPNSLRYELVHLLEQIPEERSRYRSHRTSTLTLDEYGVNLSAKAKKKELDPVVARDDETNRVIRILGRRMKPNPLLAGESGVGKSAIARGLALRIKHNDVPEFLRDRKVYSIDLHYLLTHPNGNLLLNACLREAQNERILLVIEELHLLFFPQGNATLTAASVILNSFLSSENNPGIIGIVPLSKFQDIYQSHPVLKTHFQPIMVNPSSVEESISILKVLRPNFERHHGVTISNEAIHLAVTLADQHIPSRYLPDVAIALLDETSMYVKDSDQLTRIDRQLHRIQMERKELLEFGRLEDAESLFVEELKLKEMQMEASATYRPLIVTGAHIRNIINEWMSKPSSKVVE